jgi:amino acid transporter
MYKSGVHADTLKAESLTFSLGSAGSVGMVWGYLVGCLSLIPVAISLGELGSSMPTSGGLYYVSSPTSTEYHDSDID